MILLPIVLALSAQGAVIPERPRDPFVFRCVLDKRVRIVTLALSDDLWAAWDTQTCGFYKAWKGGVKFDGAVYTTVHGPTPSSQGADYTRGLAGDVWNAIVDGQPSPARAVWRGYRIESGACVLQYDVVLKDGRAIRIEEWPESLRSDQVFNAEQREDFGVVEGLPGLVRRYRAIDVPAGVVLAVLVRTDAPGGRFIDAGGAAQEKLLDTRDEKGLIDSTEIHSMIWLDANRKTNSVTQFYEPIELPPEPKDAQPAEKSAQGGAR